MAADLRDVLQGGSGVIQGEDGEVGRLGRLGRLERLGRLGTGR